MKFNSIITVAIFALVVSAVSKEGDTTITTSRRVYTASVSLSNNLPVAQFQQLSSIPSPSPNFSGGYGTGVNLRVGLEDSQTFQLFGLAVSPAVDVSFSGLSAPLLKKEFIGNIITGNSRVEGTSEHTLTSTLSLVSLEPSLLYHLNSIPFDIRLGAFLGFMLSSDFAVEEVLTAPSGVTFENGTTIRGALSGAIPNASTFQVGLSFGTRFHSVKFSESLQLVPELQYLMSLTDVSDVSWKANSLRAGIQLTYQPVSTVVSPPPPPPPPPPPVAVPKFFNLKTEVIAKGKSLTSDREIVEIPVRVEKVIHHLAFSPRFYFEKGSADSSVPASTEGFSEIAKAVRQMLERSSTVSIVVKGVSAFDEKTEIGLSRAVRVRKWLTASGIDERRIGITSESALKEERHPELNEEKRMVTLLVNGREQLLQFDSTEENSFGDSVTIFMQPKLETNYEDVVVQGELSLDASAKQLLNERPYEYTVHTKDIPREGKNVTLVYTATNTSGEQKSARSAFTVVPRFSIASEKHEYIASKEQYVALGFCEFDKPTFWVVNDSTVLYLRKVIAEGKQVELSALTDNLGLPERNAQLRELRLKEALRLLGVEEKSIVLGNWQDASQPNSTPASRSHNRSVVARILE